MAQNCKECGKRLSILPIRDFCPDCEFTLYPDGKPVTPSKFCNQCGATLEHSLFGGGYCPSCREVEKIPNRAIYIFLLSAAIICIILAARYWDVFLGVSGIFLLLFLIIISILYFVFREAGATGDTHGDNLTQIEIRDKKTLGDDEMTQKQMREHNKELEAFKKKVDEHNKEVQALKEEVDDICLGLEDVAGVFADLGDAQGLQLLRDALVDVLNSAIDAADKRRAELRK